MDILSMSSKELNRPEVMKRLDKKHMSQNEASEILHVRRRTERRA